MRQHVSHGPHQMGYAVPTAPQGDGSEPRECITQAQMQAFAEMTYQRPAMKEMVNRGVDPDDEFDGYVLALQFKNAVPYDRIMRQFAGNPCYVEFKHQARDQWAFVLPCVNCPTSYRVQYFDKHGMIRHRSENSMELAVETMVIEGFVVLDKGAADRLSQGIDWLRGTEIAGLVSQRNSGQLTEAEFNEQRRAVDAKYAH